MHIPFDAMQVYRIPVNIMPYLRIAAKLHRGGEQGNPLSGYWNLAFLTVTPMVMGAGSHPIEILFCTPFQLLVVSRGNAE